MRPKQPAAFEFHVRFTFATLVPSTSLHFTSLGFTWLHLTSLDLKPLAASASIYLLSLGCKSDKLDQLQANEIFSPFKLARLLAGLYLNATGEQKRILRELIKLV